MVATAFCTSFNGRTSRPIPAEIAGKMLRNSPGEFTAPIESIAVDTIEFLGTLSPQKELVRDVDCRFGSGRRLGTLS
jgi:hypothetical protein